MGYEKYRGLDCTDHRPGYDAIKELQPLSADFANFVNVLLLGALWGWGLTYPDPQQWYRVCCWQVVKVLGLHFSTAAVFQCLARSLGQKIQTSETAPEEEYVQEFVQTFLGFGLVLAPLLTWTAVREEDGLPTAWKSSLVDCTHPFARSWPWIIQATLYALQVVLGLLLADAYNYWKHRAFHLEILWPWHRYHHSHRNPSALTGYAVSPMYGFATFWPLVVFSMPDVPLYFPIYGTLVIFYLLLNHYLHCGYVIPPLEHVLAKCYFMTSAWHNTHHNRGRRGWHATDQTFAEMLTLWDIWLGTYPEAAKTH